MRTSIAKLIYCNSLNSTYKYEILFVKRIFMSYAVRAIGACANGQWIQYCTQPHMKVVAFWQLFVVLL